MDLFAQAPRSLRSLVDLRESRLKAMLVMVVPILGLLCTLEACTGGGGGTGNCYGDGYSQGRSSYGGYDQCEEADLSGFQR